MQGSFPASMRFTPPVNITTPLEKKTTPREAAATSSTLGYLSECTKATFTTLSQATNLGTLGLHILYNKIAGDNSHIIPFNHTAVLIILAITPTGHKLSFRCREQKNFVEFDTDSLEDIAKRTLKGASRDETVRIIRDALETQNHFLNTDPCIKLIMSLAKIGMGHLSKAYERKKLNETSDPIKKNIMEQVLDIFQNQLTKNAATSLCADSDPVWTATSFFRAIYLIKSSHLNSSDQAIQEIFSIFEREIGSIQSDFSKPFSLNTPSLSFTAEQIRTLQSPAPNILEPTVQLIQLLTSVQVVFENLNAPLQIINPEPIKEEEEEEDRFSVTPSSPPVQNLNEPLLGETLQELPVPPQTNVASNDVPPLEEEEEGEDDPLMFPLDDLKKSSEG